jgi:hypothetical protein
MTSTPDTDGERNSACTVAKINPEVRNTVFATRPWPAQRYHSSRPLPKLRFCCNGAEPVTG